jgi:D-2-hydroxyacid dehydrogenase (NADP+)
MQDLVEHLLRKLADGAPSRRRSLPHTPRMGSLTRRWRHAPAVCVLLLVTAAAGAAPLKVLVPPMPPAQMAELRRAAPNVELVVARSERDALAKVADVEGLYGFLSPELVRAGKRLRWVQVGSAGVENDLFPEMLDSQITLTNARAVYGPPIADHALGMMICLSKGLHYFIRRQASGDWSVPRRMEPRELRGQTLLIIGLGGIGGELAKRAAACGMRVLATDPKPMRKPDYVARLAKPSEFHALLPEADFLASCVPLTRETIGMIGAREFALMKPKAYLINVSRGKVVKTDALVEALQSGRLAGAGLDVTDPEPLPRDHPLWQMENVIITPHMSGRSPGSDTRRFEVLKENLRRFAQGKPLINVVDKRLGY